MANNRAEVPPLPSAVARGSLDHGMLVLLGLVDRDPQLFERAAVAWHARWCRHVPGVDFQRSRAVLDALEGLRGNDPAAAARRLRDQCRDCDLDELESILERWADGRPQPQPAPAPRLQHRRRPWSRARSHSHVTR